LLPHLYTSTDLKEIYVFLLMGAFHCFLAQFKGNQEANLCEFLSVGGNDLRRQLNVGMHEVDGKHFAKKWLFLPDMLDRVLGMHFGQGSTYHQVDSKFRPS